MSSLKILVVDDEPNICRLLRDVMSRQGYEVTTCTDSMEAIQQAKEERFDLVFLDIKMPGLNGVQLLKGLKQMHQEATFVMITGYAGSDLVDESLNSGACICLPKPFSVAQVLDIARTAAEERAGPLPVAP